MSLLRHLEAWLRRSRLDDELREELEQHVAWKTDSLVADGVPETRRGGARRRGRQRHAPAGGLAVALGLPLARQPRPGPALWLPPDAAGARVHRRRGAVARDRDRRERRRLQPRRCGALPQAAGARPRRADRPQVDVGSGISLLLSQRQLGDECRRSREHVVRARGAAGNEGGGGGHRRPHGIRRPGVGQRHHRRPRRDGQRARGLRQLF